MDIKFHGLGVSDGIGIGKIYFIENESVILENNVEDLEIEKTKFEKAVEISKNEIEILCDKNSDNFNLENSKILESHLLILQDVEFLDEISRNILKNKWSAEYSVDYTGNRFAKIFDNMKNSYFKERAQDVKDISRRIIRNINDKKEIKFENLVSGTIILAEDVTPSDVARFNPKIISGIITAFGGKTSHSAIIAKTLGIPTVMGIGIDGIDKIKLAKDVIVDGFKGEVTINPLAITMKNYKNYIEELKIQNERLKKFIGFSTKTKNGRKIELCANIGSIEDLHTVLENGGEGVGLFRSEFIFMDRILSPSEDEQYEIYKKTLEIMGSKPVIIRTMDIGGDKKISYLNMKDEENPFLGYRAIRYCIKEPNNFKIQIRALLRAGIYGNLKIMIPMISSIDEIRATKKIFEEVKEGLLLEQINFADDIPLGIMIEVPSAAICSDILAKEVDFFSIGTNDLIQYTVAADRMNDAVSNLYTPYNPGVLRLIKMVIENGHKSGIPVGMCGTVAGDLNLIPLLINMGLDEFSVSPIDILKVRERISLIDSRDIGIDIEKLFELGSPDKIENKLKNLWVR